LAYFMLAEAARLQDLQKNVSPYCDETVLKPDGSFSTLIEPMQSLCDSEATPASAQWVHLKTSVH
jgi:hypothetical protein